MTSARQLCTFHVADLFLGLDVLCVQEVLRARELAPVCAVGGEPDDHSVAFGDDIIHPFVPVGK